VVIFFNLLRQYRFRSGGHYTHLKAEHHAGQPSFIERSVTIEETVARQPATPQPVLACYLAALFATLFFAEK
jgi:hypothetical protein